jgi:hypothetical protein
MPSSDKLGVLVVHGMGAQTSGFADEMMREVNDRLGSTAGRIEWEPVYWATALQDREEKLWDAMRSARQPDGSALALDWQTVRNFVIHNFGDALAYHRDTQPDGAYDDIHRIVGARVAALQARLPGPKSPIVVMAHSLGAHIMSNYIWDHQPPKPVNDGLPPLPTLAALITFGCNIPLFSLTFAHAKPIDLPGEGVKQKELVAAARWLNFVDRDDVLGWPIRPLYEKSPAAAKFTAREKRTVERIEDHEIAVGGLALAWNPAAHGEYWEDNDFTKPVAAYLQRLVQALDA